jgi:hypothetical protein
MLTRRGGKSWDWRVASAIYIYSQVGEGLGVAGRWTLNYGWRLGKDELKPAWFGVILSWMLVHTVTALTALCSQTSQGTFILSCSQMPPRKECYARHAKHVSSCARACALQYTSPG